MSNDKLKVIKEESKNEPVPPPPVPINECRADCPKGTCKNILTPQEVEKLLKKREEELNAIFEERMKKEINSLKERCDFVLLNEQIRASHMLCEAHRERQEKITALQTQLECKNLAGLMYVMCTERRRSTLEKLRMKEEYTNYIRALQGILTEAQDLILHLSRGYKTAARVDQEWRDKMVIILKEFQKFIYDYTGGTPETNQYFFDMPRLLSTDASIVDDPKEDPCDCADEEQKNLKMAQPVETDEDKPWWEQLDGDCRPFLMFGDMAEFNPDQRREVLNTVKATKTAPAKWKRYVFNEMFLNSECNNADVIKDEYLSRVPLPEKFECYYGEPERKSSRASLTTPEPHRVTLASIDMRGNMGSILKLITSNTVRQTNSNRATILGARDSMEIASTTKLRVKHKSGEVSRVVINVGARRASMFDEGEESWDDNEIDKPVDAKHTRAKESEEKYDEANSLGMHTDSLQVGIHTPDHDHKINYEKVCPMEKCKRMQVDSFIRSLPPYMRASPFMHFEQTFDEYETCSPEQIEILKQRIENKKKKDKEDSETELEKDPLDEWTHIEGIATQTSDMSLSLPPCTCFAPSPTPVGSEGRIYNIEDLFPMKQAMDEIHNKFFFDDNIQFNRFKVIGEDSKDTFRETQNNENTTRNRLFEITKVLRRHPSLLDIFQANTQC